MCGIKEQDGGAKQEEGGAEVNEEIDYMVSSRVILAKKPVESKAEVGDGAVKRTFGKRFGEKGVPKRLWEEVVYPDWSVLQDVW